MPTRQKQLLIALAVAVLLWQGGGWAWRLAFGPITELRGVLAKARESVDAKTDQVFAIDVAKNKLRNWQARSLSPDPGKAKRLDAVEAKRQYTEWLTELAHGVGFEELTVTPQRTSVSSKNVYVEVVVQIDGLGRLSQFYELLDRFYRTDLLQRIGRLQVTTEDVLGDPPVRFSLEASGLALADAPVRRTLFPRTSLAADLATSATQLMVPEATAFPKTLPFRVRIEQELLDVTAVSGTLWTVQRGRERTSPAEHPANSMVTLVPINKAADELTREAFRELVRTNVFVKPTPPLDYEMTFGPFAETVVVRGKTLELTLAAKDFDPARGEPKYLLAGKIPAGLTLNEQTGKLVWKPAAKLAAGDYPLTVVAMHPSAEGGLLSEELPLVLAEPNSPPKISPIAQQRVYRGQTLRLQITATDKDELSQKLTFNLAAGAPPGCQIDAASGKMTWTVGDDQPIGSATIAVTVSDDGTPAQTATTSLIVDVQDDTAKTTTLIGIVGINEQREAWFFDKLKDKKTVLRIGDVLNVAEIQAKITDMTAESVTVRWRDADHRLKLGDAVRSLTKTVDEKPAAVESSSTDE